MMVGIFSLQQSHCRALFCQLTKRQSHAIVILATTSNIRILHCLHNTDFENTLIGCYVLYMGCSYFTENLQMVCRVQGYH